MDLSFLLKGLIIGFSIAAAIGPIAILCINRGLRKGYLSGLISGMGAASADAIYGSVAAFGLTFISSFLVKQQLGLQIIGMIFLFYLGITIFIKKPKENKTEKLKNKGLVSDYLSTLFLTLTNPMTILSFTAVFAGLGLAQSTGNYLSALTLVLGFFLGSALVYLLLSIITGLFRKKINSGVLAWINRISGLIILGFAVVILFSLIRVL
jgi:threonine/homoserine/homoserine lactone efflux protein